MTLKNICITIAVANIKKGEEINMRKRFARFKKEQPQEIKKDEEISLILKRWSRFKVYIERSRWYATFLQMLLMIAIFIQTSGFEMKWYYYPIILVSTVCLFIVFGYFEVKSGLLKYEQQKLGDENPILQEILKEIKEKCV